MISFTPLHGTARHGTSQRNTPFLFHHITPLRATSPHVTAPRNATSVFRHSTSQHASPQHITPQRNTTSYFQHSAARHDTTRHGTTHHSTTQQPLTTMPSIAEIIAARIAAKQAAAAPDTTPRESMTEKLELDALDARLAPVKPTVAAAARKATGIVLSRDLPPSSPNGEARGQATPIKGPEDRRSLGETEGEGIDMTPMAADECIKDWHKAVNAFSTDLCIMRDPIDPERAWLAVRLEDEPLHPLLLRDLPLYEHPRTPRPTNQPF